MIYRSLTAVVITEKIETVVEVVKKEAEA